MISPVSEVICPWDLGLCFSGSYCILRFSCRKKYGERTAFRFLEYDPLLDSSNNTGECSIFAPQFEP